MNTDGVIADWQDFPVVDDSPDHSSSGETLELIDSGYGALVAWEAGPRNVRRISQRDGSARPVRVTLEAAGRPAVSWDEELTADDVHSITSDIDIFLADAGVPPRPPGYRWLLDLPPGSTTAREFWELLNLHVAELSEHGRQPSQTRRTVAAALRRIWNRPNPCG